MVLSLFQSSDLLLEDDEMNCGKQLVYSHIVIRTYLKFTFVQCYILCYYLLLLSGIILFVER